MTEDTILILTAPHDPQIARLKKNLPGPNVIASDSPASFAAHAANATVLSHWSGSSEFFRKVFTMCPHLRWVHSRSVGLDKSLFPELIASPVPLTNGSGVFSPALGEFVLGAILYFAKDFRRLIRNQIAQRWEAFDITMAQGKTLGIVGYGDIGKAIAARTRPLGMKVLALKRSAPNPGEKDSLVQEFFGPAQRIEMLSRCDYIAVATPLTPETRGMIAEPEFAAVKPTAVIINVGRGPVIDEDALLRALSENRIKGAALDVFDREPLPAGHPFYSLENVLLSPHSADHTPDWLDNSTDFFIEQFNRYRKGQPLLNLVDKKLGY
jgi:phosphoglycerate dehydrogenase-like enzyme